MVSISNRHAIKDNVEKAERWKGKYRPVKHQF